METQSKVGLTTQERNSKVFSKCACEGYPVSFVKTVFFCFFFRGLKTVTGITKWISGMMRTVISRYS